MEDYRATTGSGLLAVGHDPVLLRRWFDRGVHWDSLTPSAATTPHREEPTGVQYLRPADGT